MRAIAGWVLLFAGIAILSGGHSKAARSASDVPLRIAAATIPSEKNNPYGSPAIMHMWFYAAVYDALTFITKTGEVVPWLAATWERPTPNVWIVRLRDGVVFSDGTPLTSHVVKRNFDYLLSTAGATEVVSRYIQPISRVIALDDLTLRFETNRPDPLLPRALSLIRIAVLRNGGEFEKYALSDQAIGTGPYQVDRWNVSGVELSAARKSWRRAPTQFLIGMAVPNPNSRRSALTSGRVDVALSAFDASDFQDTARPYRIKREPLPSVVGLAYNAVRNPALRDERVRIALELATNRMKIIGTLLNGWAPFAAQPARHEYFGFNTALAPRPYDPDRARALLMEAGYGNGLTLKMLLTSGTVVWDEVFQALASDLKKVGVTLSIQPVPQQVMADYRLHGGVPADAFAVAYSSPTLDGLEILREHSCLWPNPWFCDEVTAQLIEKAELESDLGKREQLVMDLQARVHESAQGMFLYESVGLSGYSRRIDVYLTDFGFPRYELMTVRDSEH